MANYFKTAKAFSEQSKDLADGIKAFAKDAILERKGDIRAFSAHSREEQNKLINKEFMAEVAKRSGYSLAEGASNTEAMRYASNPMVKYFANQIKTEMIDMILPDVLMNGALRYIAEFKYADLGDTISFNIENNTLFTVSKAGYRKRNTNIQKSFKTTVTMSGENHMITVGDDLYNIVTGFANIADDVMRATLSMETCMLFEAYSNFTNAMNNLTGNLKVVNYSEKGLIKLCETVTAYNQGRKAVILGTPSALKSVLPSNANYRYLLDSEYVKLGHLQTFNGYDVVPLEQVADPFNNVDYSLKLDDTKIYVVSPASDKIVKIGVFGGTFSRSTKAEDSANLLETDTLAKGWEVATITNSVAGEVENLETH